MTQRRRVIVALLIAALGAGLGVVLSRPSEQDRVLRACHDAIRKAPGGTAARYDEQVATPRKHSYVVTGAVGPSLRTAKQWTCQATVADGVVRISSAEIES